MRMRPLETASRVLGKAIAGAQFAKDAAFGETFAAIEKKLDALLGEPFESRVARVPLSLGPSGVDPFGLDPKWAKYAIYVVAALHRRYFRTEVFGIENVPEGRVLIVANHSGQIPMDGALVAAAMFLDLEPPRIVRAMVEKWAVTLPFVSLFLARVGQVVGVVENAERLLNRDEALLVFPEGSRGISKTFDERYKLTNFGLGFMRLALATNTPIVPLAIIGGEEQYVSVANARSVAKVLGIPSVPIVPQLLIPGGQLPLPTKYRMYFGEPMHFTGDADDDDLIIEKKVAKVRAQIQSMVNRGILKRKHIFW